MTNTLRELKERLAAQGMVICQVVSGSMEPVIMTGEDIRVTAAHPNELKRFDILVFEQEGKLICHALWSKNTLPGPNGQKTWNTLALSGKGKYFDFPVPDENILGRVTSHQIPTGTRAKVILSRLFQR